MFCRTPEDAFRAGWQAAENTPPLTQTQIDRLVLLHRPYLMPDELDIPQSQTAR